MQSSRQDALQAELDRRDRVNALQSELDSRQSNQPPQQDPNNFANESGIVKSSAAGAVEGTNNLLDHLKNALINSGLTSQFVIDSMKNKMLGPLTNTQPVQSLSAGVNNVLSDPYKAFGVPEAKDASSLSPMGLASTLGKYASGGELGDMADAGKIVPKVAEEIPYIGKALPGLANRAAIGSGTELNERDPTLQGAAENAGANMLITPVAEKLAQKTMSTIMHPIDAMQSIKDALTPNSLAKSITDKLSGGKTLEEHAQDFASNIKQTYQNVKGAISDKYNKLFSQDNLGEKDMYPVQNPTGFHQVATRDIPDFPNGSANPDYDKALSDFNDNPTVKNGHELQSQLANDARNLKKQLYINSGDEKIATPIANKLKITQDSRNQLLQKMYDSMGDKADAYKSLTKEYLDNVTPFHSDSNLRDIIFGRNANPSKNKISGIFKNPDEDTKTVLSHLGPNAKNDVLFQAIGEQPKDINAKTLANRIANINKNGFESYVDKDLKNKTKSLKLGSAIEPLLKGGLMGIGATVGAGGLTGLGYEIHKHL